MNSPYRSQPKRDRALTVSLVAAATSIVLLGVVAVFTLGSADKPAVQTASGSGASVTPTAQTTEPSTGSTVRAVSQFASGDTGEWGCDNNCRFADGRLHLSVEVEPDTESTDWWHQPGQGWVAGDVTRSTVTVENVSFQGYPDRSYIGIKCGSRVVDDRLTDAYQVEVLGDGTVQFFEYVNGAWEQSGTPTKHSGNATDPGDITFTCQDQGPDYRVSVALSGLESETVFRGVDRRGTTLLAYGGYADPGTRVGVSLSGVRYEATV